MNTKDVCELCGEPVMLGFAHDLILCMLARIEKLERMVRDGNDGGRRSEEHKVDRS